jgi:hypothetical protein
MSVHNNTNTRVRFDNHFSTRNSANGQTLDQIYIFLRMHVAH